MSPAAEQASMPDGAGRQLLYAGLLVVGALVVVVGLILGLMKGLADAGGPGKPSVTSRALATAPGEPLPAIANDGAKSGNHADGVGEQRSSAKAASRMPKRPGPLGMRWIPPGEFTMGTDDPHSMPNERPSHRVRLDGFWIDEHDVTNAEFRRFVEATGYVTMAERKPVWEELKKELPPGTPRPDDSKLQPGSLVFTPAPAPVPLDDMSAWWRWVIGACWRHPEGPWSTLEGRESHPVVQVSWEDAVAYAKWAGKRLPTEAEWEYAARGGLEGKRFSWGNEFQPGGKHMANTYQGQFPVKDTGEDGFVGTSPVGSFPPNGYGLYDMAGNVWQWCSDWYRVDAHEKSAAAGCCANPKGPADSFDPDDPYAPRRVVKGGSFLCNPSYCESYRPSARRGTPPDTSTSHTGFRCVKSGNAK